MKWLTVNELHGKLAKGVRPLDVAVRKAGAPDVEQPALGEEQRLVKFVLSDGGVDRDKDTVSSKGWDLANYKANPVVLFAHDYEQLPVAKTVSIGVEDGKLKATAEFMPKELNPLSDTIYRMIKGGWLSGVSVGFKPKDFDYNTERKGVDFHAQELMEWSIVPIPSHPSALVEAKAAGIDLAPVRKWAVETLVAVQKAGMAKCPECGSPVVPGGKTCPTCGAAMKAASIPGGMPPQGMDGPSGGAPRHEHGTGDPLRDVEGCSSGALCPKMKNQPCPLAEGCPMQKGAARALHKRGRMISAANEAKLRAAALSIESILNRLSPSEISDVMSQVADDHTPDPNDPMKAWPPGSQPQSGTGFPENPPPPQPGVEAQQNPPAQTPQESAKITASAGLMVAFLANLAAETAALLQELAPLTGDANATDTDDTAAPPTDGTKPPSANVPPKKPNPFASGKGVVKYITERDGQYCVMSAHGKTLGCHATRAEALAQLGAVEANKSADADAVEEFLLEIEEEVSADMLDLGDLTPEDLVEVIKAVARSRTQTIAHDAAAQQDRIRRGRVD